MQLSEIQMNYGLMSDDEDDEISCYTSDDILHSARQDVISNSLAETGTINGMAAAAALSTVRRKSKCFKFEMDPAVRKRIQTRLTKKLKQIIDELCSRCGQQAVVVSVSPGKENSSFRVFGSQPLDQAVRVCQTSILGEFEKDLQAKVDAKNIPNNEPLFQLPSLAVGGIPTSVDRMNQAQLRMFIPEMLKYATGRGKPGWGKETMKPIWWPIDVPWANVRCDVRDDEIKHKVPWSQALRQIVKNCYQFHNREDLLNGISYDRSNQSTNCTHVATASTTCHKLKLPPNQQAVITPPTFVHTIHNADGSVALVHYDSGQTLATISADNADNALAALHTTSDNEIRLDEMNATWELTANSDSIANTTTYNVIESEVGQHQLLAEEGMELAANEETSGERISLFTHLYHHLLHRFATRWRFDGLLREDENLS